jgi:hypothetical protein
MSEIQPASSAQVDQSSVLNPVDQNGQFNGRAVIAGLYTNMRYSGVATLSDAQQRDIDRLVQLNHAVNKRLDNAEKAMRLLVAYDFTDGSDNDLTEQIRLDYKKIENYFLDAEIASLEAELHDPEFPNTVMNIKRLSLPEADISSDDGSFDYDALYDNESSKFGAGAVKSDDQQLDENDRTFGDGNSMPDFTNMTDAAIDHYFNRRDKAGANHPKDDGVPDNDQGDAVL